MARAVDETRKTLMAVSETVIQDQQTAGVLQSDLLSQFCSSLNHLALVHTFIVHSRHP